MVKPIPALLLFLTLSAAMPVAAQDAGRQDHRACAAIADPGARLACYDRHFPPGSQAATNPAVSREAQQRDEFGLSRQQVRQQQPEQTPAPITRIEARITALTQRSGGERVVTLDNDQVWLLPEVSARGHLQVGDAVAVRTAALGSFMMVTPQGIAVRAKRLR